MTPEALVARKREKIAKSVRKQGWKWGEVANSSDYPNGSKCERRYLVSPQDSVLLK